MSDIAIKVEGLSKSYQIRKGLQKEGRYTALRDVLTDGAHLFFKNVRQGKNPFNEPDQMETFWALKDINFEVNKGEVLGVIGRNGAGKSTLLKILSRITEPDKGRITLNGRVSSLLEVGTGFHPELTGRENIYMSGAILGMKREEIKRRFDEIVDFSGIEQFLETPIKRYSSGMYVRLGFAVAAHLETEILLVDEVLAVGDSDFKRRCDVKLKQISKYGKTILVVSHDIGIISSLSSKILALDKGCLKTTDSPAEAMATLFEQNIGNRLIYEDGLLIEFNMNLSGIFKYSDGITFNIRIDVESILDCILSITLWNAKRDKLMVSERILNIQSAILLELTCQKSLFLQGEYFVSIKLKDVVSSRVFKSFEDVGYFQIIDRPEFYLRYPVESLGVINDAMTWKVI